ncbi:MAG: hypothetical protein AAGK78_08960, partial [Planctomycetota bacterium]
VQDFAYLAVMPGESPKEAKLFLATADRIWKLATTMNPPDKKGVQVLLRDVLAAIEGSHALLSTTAQHERLSLVTHHLNPSRKVPGVWLRVSALTEKSFSAALRSLAKTKPVETDESDAGEARGLQSA